MPQSNDEIISSSDIDANPVSASRAAESPTAEANQFRWQSYYCRHLRPDPAIDSMRGDRSSRRFPNQNSSFQKSLRLGAGASECRLEWLRKPQRTDGRRVAEETKILAGDQRDGPIHKPQSLLACHVCHRRPTGVPRFKRDQHEETLCRCVPFGNSLEQMGKGRVDARSLSERQGKRQPSGCLESPW